MIINTYCKEDFEHVEYYALNDKICRALNEIFLSQSGKTFQNAVRVMRVVLTIGNSICSTIIHCTQKNIAEKIENISTKTVYRALKYLEEKECITKTISKNVFGVTSMRIELHMKKILALCGLKQDSSCPEDRTQSPGGRTQSPDIYIYKDIYNKPKLEKPYYGKSDVAETTTEKLQEKKAVYDLRECKLDEETAVTLRKTLNTNIATTEIENIVRKTAISEKWKVKIAFSKEKFVHWITKILSAHMSSNYTKTQKQIAPTPEQVEAQKAFEQEQRKKTEIWDRHELTKKLKDEMIHYRSEALFRSWLSFEDEKDFKFEDSVITLKVKGGVTAEMIKKEFQFPISRICEKYKLQFNVTYYDKYYQETKVLKLHNGYC